MDQMEIPGTPKVIEMTPEQKKKESIIVNFGEYMGADLINNLRLRKWSIKELEWLEYNLVKEVHRHAESLRKLFDSKGK